MKNRIEFGMPDAEYMRQNHLLRIDSQFPINRLWAVTLLLIGAGVVDRSINFSGYVWLYLLVGSIVYLGEGIKRMLEGVLFVCRDGLIICTRYMFGDPMCSYLPYENILHIDFRDKSVKILRDNDLTITVVEYLSKEKCREIAEIIECRKQRGDIAAQFIIRV